MNGNKLLQRCTLYCSLFSICNCHTNLLEWCFVGCYIILFGVATLVMSIAYSYMRRLNQCFYGNKVHYWYTMSAVQQFCGSMNFISKCLWQKRINLIIQPHLYITSQLQTDPNKPITKGNMEQQNCETIFHQWNCRWAYFIERYNSASTNCKIDFRLNQLGMCLPFWPKTSSGMSFQIVCFQ